MAAGVWRKAPRAAQKVKRTAMPAPPKMAPRDVGRQRAFVSAMLVTLFVATLLWEIYTMLDGKSHNTISAVIRDANRKTGGLPALLLAALWVHWFLDWPASWHSGTPAVPTPSTS
jgi:hypothetical protein